MRISALIFAVYMGSGLTQEPLDTTNLTWEDLGNGKRFVEIKNNLDQVTMVTLCDMDLEPDQYNLTRIETTGSPQDAGSTWLLEVNDEFINSHQGWDCELQIVLTGQPFRFTGLAGRFIRRFFPPGPGQNRDRMVFRVTGPTPAPDPDPCKTCSIIRGLVVNKMQNNIKKTIKLQSPTRINLGEAFANLKENELASFTQYFNDLPQGIPRCCLHLTELLDMNHTKNRPGFDRNQYRLNSQMSDLISDHATLIKEMVRDYENQKLTIRISITAFCDEDYFQEGKSIALTGEPLGTVRWNEPSCPDNERTPYILPQPIPYDSSVPTPMEMVPSRMTNNCQLSAVRAWIALHALQEALDLPDTIEVKTYYMGAGILPGGTQAQKAANRKFLLETQIYAGKTDPEPPGNP